MHILGYGGVSGQNNLAGMDFQKGAVKPTVRSNGAALQAGDAWYSTADGLWFYWDGSTYWRTEQYRDYLGSSSQGQIAVNPAGLDYWIDTFELAGVTGVTNTGAAYLEVYLERRSNAADTVIATINTSTIAASTRFYLSQTVNLHLDASALNLTSLRTVSLPIGGGSTLTGQVQGILYRLVKP